MMSLYNTHIWPVKRSATPGFEPYTFLELGLERNSSVGS